AMDRTRPNGAGGPAISLPEAASHSFTSPFHLGSFPSKRMLDANNVLPSALQATQQTSPRCSDRVAFSLPVAASHRSISWKFRAAGVARSLLKAAPGQPDRGA